MVKPKRVKVTMYLDPARLAELDRERQRRIMAGVRRSATTVTALLNEAVGEWAKSCPGGRRYAR